MKQMFVTLRKQNDAYLYDGARSVSIQDVSATRTGARPYCYAVIFRHFNDAGDPIAPASYAIADSDEQLRILMEINKFDVDDSRWV